MEALTLVDVIRKRPELYLGADKSTWIITLLGWLLEVPYGHTEVDIKLGSDGSISMKDDGVGVSTQLSRQPAQGHSRPFLEAVVLAFALIPDSPRSIGLSRGFERRASHGLCFVNVFSTWLDVRVCREAESHYLRTEDGKITVPLVSEGNCSRSGNWFSFLPNDTFVSTKDISGSALSRLLQEVASREKCTVRIVDERSNPTTANYVPETSSGA